MTAQALKHITDALCERLRVALNKSGTNGKVFAGPLDASGASDAALVLFLYRIVPNASLRNREHRVQLRTSEAVKVFQNALPLDLYYLLTVGTTPYDNEEQTTPLLWLGHAMQALQIEPDVTGPDVEFETVRVTLEPLSTEEASRIWTLFPTANYRTSVAYLATPVWIDPTQVTPLAHPVLEEQLVAGSKIQEAKA